MSFRHLLFGFAAGLVGGVVGWVGTPLVYVPWLWLRARLRRMRRPA